MQELIHAGGMLIREGDESTGDRHGHTVRAMGILC